MNGHHTSSMSRRYITDTEVLPVAEARLNGRYPFIEYCPAGHIVGMIRATRVILAAANRCALFSPGHGAVGDREALVRWQYMLITIRGRVARLKQQEGTAADAVAAKSTAAIDAAHGRQIIGPNVFTRLVCKGA